MSNDELKIDAEFVFNNAALEGSTQSKDSVFVDCSEVQGVVFAIKNSIQNNDSTVVTLLERMKSLFPVQKE